MSDYDIRLSFRRCVARFADHIAFESATATRTYAELDAASDHLARQLTAHGIAKGSIVGILPGGSLDVALGILGALKAGCAFMPIDPRTPRERLTAMLETASPAGVLVGETYAGPIPPAGGVVVTLSEGASAGAAGGGPLAEMAPDDLCYVYFTSGSTGRPKAIAGRFKSIAHFVRWEIETLKIEAAGWRVSQLTSPAFDACLRDLFVPLTSGGTVCVPGDEVVGDAAGLLDWLAAAGIHLLHCVPSLLRTFLAVEPHRPLPELRWALLSGEPLLPSDVAAWYELHGTSTRLMNLYGPSETTMTKLFYPVEPSDATRRTIPIGRPMPGARAVVLDARGRVCPPRGVGEIYIRTPFRSLGYYGRPDLTDEVFVPNPFGNDPQDRIYKTGDMGRMLESGDFEFLGRRDQQVKIRGVRIELTEIEHLLLTHPAVAETAVIDRDDGSGTKYLAAYVVAASETSATELREHLAAKLSEHSLPSAIVFLETLPRTLTGKIDRRQLPAPERLRNDDALALPRSPVEEILAALFAQILGLDRVGIHESFFQIGGHSLLATQLLARVRGALAVEVPLRELFEAPTVAGLARAVAAARHQGTVAAPPLEPVPRDEPQPLSFAQQRLWFLDRLEPLGATYNIALAMRFAGRLDTHALATSLRAIDTRHEVLRTVFAVRDGQPVQFVRPRSQLALQTVDLGTLAATRRESVAEHLMTALARRPFDLERGPLARVTLLRLAADQYLGVLTLHHVAADAWSLGIFLNELGVHYTAAVAGVEAVLPELPVQYVDFAVWQRRWLTGETLAAHLAYWKEHLAGAAEALELPTDRPRPALPSYRGSRVLGALPGGLTAELGSLARRLDATLFMVLLAAFEVLLQRYAGSRQIQIGTPVANRTRTEVEGLLGIFVNTLVLKTDLAGDPSFDDLVGRVKQVALDAYSHQDLPFEKLVEEIQPQRHLARTPLFQVLFVLQNAPLVPLELPGLTLTPVPLDTGTAKFDLTLTAAPQGEGLDVAFEYSAELFDGTTVERMLRHYRCLAAAAVAARGRRISELPLSSPAEVHQVLREWNDTARDAPQDQLLHQLFERCAAARPDAVALSFEESALSYRELDRQADQLADRLRSVGCGHESRIAVCLERSLELVVSLVGILKAGGAYVPLDPDYPGERLKFMIEDCDAAALVTSRRRAAGLAGRVPQVIVGASVAVTPHGSTVPPPMPESPAYVIYTSGSTGQPKGVAVSHRAILNRLLWMRETYRLGGTDRVLQKTPITFDVSVWELFWPLVTGARLELARPGGHRDSAYLARLIAERSMTVLHFVPSMLRAFLEQRDLSGCGSLRYVFASGEALGTDLAERLHQRLDVPLYNLYGPTEAAVEVTYQAVTPSLVRRSVPIGRPISNTRIHLLDQRLGLLPAGVPGELTIAGVNLARGYLRRPALTAERFVPDPMTEEAGGRLYRTGDRARYHPDGTVEFLGRRDHQVKLRGFRIELGEIEAALAERPEIAKAVVVTRDDGPGGERRLVAYLVPAPDTEPAVADVRSFLIRRLPAHMIPAAFFVLDALPLTPSGKIDRRALPAPPALHLESGREARPVTPTEDLVVCFWEEILDLYPLGAEDNFFELGGHSLLATRVMARIVDSFGVEIPLRELFMNPTPRQLARRVEEAVRAGEGPGPELAPIGRGGALPLSFAQQRLWFLDYLEPGSAAYNLPLALELRGALNRPALKRALAEIVSRHEVLRTTLTTIDGKPWQVIAPPSRGPGLVPVIDLTALEASARRGELRRQIDAEAARPFRLDHEPWLRLALLELGRDHAALLVTMHHIASDGLSLEIFRDELVTLYRAFSSGESSPLPEPGVQYTDFAVWQRRCLTEERVAAELAYWRERLAAVPALVELATDRPRPAVRSWAGSVAVRPLSGGLTATLAALGRRRGATLFMVVLAAFATLLRRTGGGPVIPVGTPVSGRNRRQLEGLIGFFVNTLVVPADIAGDPSFAALLDRLRASVLESLAHQAVPFEKLVEELAPERALSHSPIFQVMLAWQHTAGRPPEVEGLTVMPVGAASGRAKFDLTLVVRDGGEGLRCELEYGRELFDRTTVLRLLAGLERLLAGAAVTPEQRLTELPLLARAERHQLLHGWNDTRRGGSGESVVARFLAQAKRNPQRTALRFDGGHVTFRDLAASALALAGRLREHRVGPDVVVGVCLERSPELVAGVLGILAAGGAYLPLDPAYPGERLRYLIADSGARLVVGRQDAAPAGLGAAVEWLELPTTAGDGEPADLPAAPHPESLAYVIYTSGSTGQPKGTLISHRALAHYLDWSTAAYVDPGTGGAPLASSIGFDLTVTSLFTPLLVGRPVTLVAEERGPEGLSAALTAGGFGLVKVTPSHLALLAQGLSPAQLAGATRLLILGGEALAAERLAPWREHAPTTRVINEYGPTEATVGCAVYEVDAELTCGDVPIGRPIPNTCLQVLDGRRLQPQPIGISGELHIGGEGLARGYLGRPARTAEHFLPDPASAAPGARLYRTGDLVRWRADGNLQFIGRIDRQLKVRGFRIEPGEIEAALTRIPEVGEAAVAARTDGASEPRLVAWVVLRPGAEPAPSGLRRQLAEWLPPHLVPAAFVFLESLPLTAHGKVDERALPAPEARRPELDTGYREPGDRAEEQLAAIWADVLGLDRVGVNDNFFHLGGDSILSIQIVSRASRAGLHLTVRQIFEHQTVAALAAVVGTAQPVEAEQGAVTGEVPLTPVARWFFAQELTDQHHYNQALMLTAESWADGDALGDALEVLLRHHDALRLRFDRGKEVWRQEASPAAAAKVGVFDLSGLPAASQDAALTALASGLQASFDLDRGPLLRAGLFRMGESRRDRLLLVIHHLVVDGVSWRVLLEDLEAAYSARRAGREPLLPPKTTSFKRWAEHLAEQARSGETARELPFWLADGRRQVAALPVDVPAHDNTVAGEDVVTVALSESETEALLKQVPRAYRTEINDGLLTPLAQTLADWTGSRQVLVDLEGHGREEMFPGVDLSRTVGWFTAIFPVLLSVDGEVDPGAALMAVKEQLRRVPNRGLGYGLLRYLAAAEPAALLAALPAAEVSFNYLGQLDRATADAARSFEPAPEGVGALRSPRQQRRYLLEVNARVFDGRLSVSFLFSRRHERATVERLAAAYLKRLRALIRHCASAGAGGVTPSDFPLAELDQEALLAAISQVGQATG